MSTPILELRDVAAGYGPFRALFGVSLSLQPGRSLAVLGANSSGKTTVARVACGLVSPAEGHVFVEGADLTGARPFRFAQAGVLHAPEGRSVFATLTVEENLALSFRRSKGARGVAPALDRAFDLFPRLGERRRQMAGTLSGGEQRMLSLSRVMVEEPKVLIADELSLGLAPIVVDEVYETLATINQSGTALLIIEQFIGHALAVVDEAVFLNHGEVMWSGPAAEARGRAVEQILATSKRGDSVL